MNPPPDSIPDLLDRHGVRPTRQRVALARLLLCGPERHVTAEALYTEATAAGEGVSLATVYNTLHQLRGVGLVHEVFVDQGRSYFDTNTRPHVHVYNEDTGELWDADPHLISAAGLEGPVPHTLPKGTALARVDVVVRVRNAG